MLLYLTMLRKSLVATVTLAAFGAATPTDSNTLNEGGVRRSSQPLRQYDTRATHSRSLMTLMREPGLWE